MKDSSLFSGLLNGLDDSTLFTLVLFTVFALLALFYESRYVAKPKEKVRHRLDDLIRRTNGPASQPPPDPMQAWLERLRFLVPAKSKDLDDAVARLRYAGFRSSDHLTAYYSLRFVMLIGLPAALFVLLGLGDMPQSKINLYSAMAGGAGLILPSYLLDKAVARRQVVLRNSLPDMLDLLVVCSEAGLGVNPALIRVSREIQGMHPALALELSTVISEIQGGLDRETAMLNMISRTGIKEIKSLVLVINQTLRLGTSLAESLRVYSDEYRDTRMKAAEENAAKLSTKMIFPLVLCFLPCFFIVSVGPAATMMLKALAR